MFGESFHVLGTARSDEASLRGVLRSWHGVWIRQMMGLMLDELGTLIWYSESLPRRRLIAILA